MYAGCWGGLCGEGCYTHTCMVLTGCEFLTSCGGECMQGAGVGCVERGVTLIPVWF